MSNWEVYGTELWYVECGELVCESGPEKKYGYLGTKKYYDDFDLFYEFKQVADGNSGVFIRSIVNPGTAKIAKVGWQVEVAPPGKHTGGIYESGGGRRWLIKPSVEKEDILKMGEWNTMRIRAVDDSLTTWLNGRKMIQIKDSILGAGQGRIMLQIHGGGGIKLKWKDINIKEISN